MKRLGHHLGILVLSLASSLLSPAARADDGDGRWQVKILGSAVLPNGKVKNASGPAALALIGSDTKANNNYVPTVAIEYFATKQISFETICCVTEHHVTGTGALAGVPIVNHVQVVPFTLTAKYHFDLGSIKPYVGAGPALLVFASKDTSPQVQALGLQKVSIPAQFSGVVQAGVDIPLSVKGLSATLDVKRYFSRPLARFTDNQDNALLSTRLRLDPWVVSAGFGYRF